MSEYYSGYDENDELSGSSNYSEQKEDSEYNEYSEYIEYNRIMENPDYALDSKTETKKQKHIIIIFCSTAGMCDIGNIYCQFMEHSGSKSCKKLCKRELRR